MTNATVRRDTHRLEALSDGVFAFAATLLVVSLEVPDTFQDMARDLAGFGAFAISFTALMLIWSVHHGYFRRYALADGVTTFLNSALLLVVLFYVYPLKFVTRGLVQTLSGWGPGTPLVLTFEELSQLFALYSAGFVALFLCVALMYRHAWRLREPLAFTPLQVHEAAMWFRHYLIIAGVGLLSAAMALLGLGIAIGAPGWIYALIGPLAWAHGSWSDRRRPVDR
jgi:uncharacterized membrane protein